MEYRSDSLSEFNIIMDKLSYGKKELDTMIDNVVKKYPQIDSKKDAIYLIAKEKKLQFTYDTDGKCAGVTSEDPDLDVSLDQFIK